jgi:hypothetical protein
MLLVIKRCPHTGVTNFYSDDDPHMAVGSIARRDGDGFTWRCYTDGPELAGRAPDFETAEVCLSQFLLPAEDGRAHGHLAS